MSEFDIQKQVEYWRNGATDALDAANDMILRDKRILFGLFFLHLAVEKILKAHVCRRTMNFAPRLHNLVRLAILAEIALSDEQIMTLASLNEFSLEGRYPETWAEPPTPEQAEVYLLRSRQVFEWLMNLL
jgi:HEPN domain-containing protein